MSFLRTLPDTLQQPAALAMLGSLGAHLLFFATLPAFTNSTEPRPEAEVRRVRLLEPPQGNNSQATGSQLRLPPVPNPNTPNSRIQLPRVGQGTSPVPNPLYTIPDLTPVPPPAFNTTPQINSQNAFNELLRRIAARQQTIRIPKPPAVQPSPSPSPSPSPGLKPADPRDAIASASPSPTTPPQPTTQPTTSPTPSPSPSPQTRIDQLLALTAYNSTGTTQQELLTASTNYVQTLQQKNIAWERILLRQPTDPIQEVPFPAGLVLNNYASRQHPVAIAILVDKDGKILPDTKPEILASTGYGILNQKAEEIVKANATPEKLVPLIQAHEAQKDPNSRNKAQAYLLIYEFKFKAPNAGTASIPQQRSEIRSAIATLK